jgi:hypothetical protein
MGVSATFAENALALNNLVATQLSFRNRIINGNCNIAQRPATAFNYGTGGYGGPDRFYADSASSAGEFTQSQGTIVYEGTTYYAVTQTVNVPIGLTTGSYYWYGINQRIEGFNSYDLTGQPITVSFIFNTNVSGVYTVNINTIVGTTTGSYITTFTAVANVPQYVVINVPMIPLDLGPLANNSVGLMVSVGFINTGTYETSVLNEWQDGDYHSATGATNWGMTAGNFIALTNLQLEPGTEATPFETRLVSTEFSLCQRYYQTVIASARFYALAAGVWTDTTITWQIMRAIPTATLITAPATNNVSSYSLLSMEQMAARFEIVSTAADLDTYALLAGYSLSAEL